ncbi:MAG: gliding motility-associated C-terminal domain-containing protein, partial [Muribaculaceae bacterium]|nr:gliding motility-associated C-terminal domain-containing protein [Muribaculaceae bacterium]
DRYGRQLYYFDNPDDGWDGMRGDKPVSPGVYYYVIQATGADGKKYKKSGDINIIRHVDRSGSSSDSLGE